jgi:hypothetical protein
LGSERPFIGPEPACGISAGISKRAFRDWTETIKNTGNPQQNSNRQRDTYEEELCQMNQGTVKIKQKPLTMGDRTTYRTLSPERTPLQNGINE